MNGDSHLPPLRVLVADDQRLVRAGLRRLLETDQRMSVVAEAADGHEAVEATHRLRPDVVLMDIRMPRLDGLAAARELARTQSHARVVVLTTYDLDEYVFEALRVGASGFLLKDAPPEQLIEAVHLVAAGEALLAPTVTRRLIAAFSRLAPRPDPRLARLTARERQVLELLAEGLSNAEIAARLFLGEATVKTHVTAVLAKTGSRDRVQAVVFAFHSGVASVGPT